MKTKIGHSLLDCNFFLARRKNVKANGTFLSKPSCFNDSGSIIIIGVLNFE